MTGTIKAVDISRWSGKVTLVQWRALRSAGYKLAVIGLWDGTKPNPFAAQNIESAKVAGLAHASYIALGPALTSRVQIRTGMRSLGEKAYGRFMALDVELPIEALHLRNAVTELQARNVRTVIYTSRSKWAQVLGNTQEFSDIPLWDAHYTEDPTLSAWNPYGGWDRRIGAQFAANQSVATVNADLNVFDKTWFNEGL